MVFDVLASILIEGREMKKLFFYLLGYAFITKSAVTNIFFCLISKRMLYLTPRTPVIANAILFSCDQKGKQNYSKKCPYKKPCDKTTH